MVSSEGKPKPQDVKLRGFLWTTKCFFSILRDILIIILVLALLASVLLITPVVIKLSGSLGQVAGAIGGGNGQDALGMMGGVQGGSNTDQQQNTNQDEYTKSLAERMRQAVDQGDWTGAMNTFKTIKSSAQQASPEQQQAFQQLEQTLKYKDKEAFYNTYCQFMPCSRE